MSMYSQEIGADTSWPVEATRRMNRMYRRQRHIYDGTRRYYLLGRDQLIANLGAAAGANVLEIGCGTGRNLVHAARLYPDARFFGIDISTEMLTSAISAISRRDLSRRIRVAHGDGNGLPSADFVRHRPVRPCDDFLQPVDDPGLAPCAAGGRKPSQAPADACILSILAIRSVCPDQAGHCCGDGLRCSTSRRATISSASCR